MVFNAWCPNQNVNLDTCKVWLVMCLSNLLLEHFFLLEKDWLSLLEIRLFLKKWEAATFTLASKVWSSSVQLVSKLSLRCASGFRWEMISHDLTWTDKVQRSISIRHTDPPAVPCTSLQSAALLLQAAVLEPLPHDFQMVCIFVILTGTPIHAVGRRNFNGKTFLKAPASSSSTCCSAFTAVVCCTSSCASVLNDSNIPF